MDTDEIQRRIDAIRGAAGDDERAHCLEDDLHQDVLRAIAAGNCENPKECAAAALRTLGLNFSRWCA